MKTILFHSKLALILLRSMIGPIGVSLGILISKIATPFAEAIIMALTAGTFIFVGATEVIITSSNCTILLFNISILDRQQRIRRPSRFKLAKIHIFSERYWIYVILVLFRFIHIR